MVTNAGTVIWPASASYLYLGAPFYNLAGALFHGQNDGYGILDDGGGVFNNAGINEQSVASGTSSINVPFTNTGTLEVQTGTVSLNSSYDLTNGTLNFGINSATNFGQISLSGSPALLAGTISATLISNYVPPVNTAFQVLNYPSSSGTFTNTNLPPVAVWQTSYNPANVTIEVLKWVPQLTWAKPANIVYGTLLSGAQLDATPPARPISPAPWLARSPMLPRSGRRSSPATTRPSPSPSRPPIRSITPTSPPTSRSTC